jgi:hypothetical protein
MNMKAASTIVAAFSVIALLGSGCGGGPHPGGREAASNESREVAANSVFGNVDIKETPDLCAGRVQLVQGAATINDNCFTGDTNIVLCSDASSASAVQCAASNGKLALTGTGTDLINYARVR